jgi:SAM-dependent methyltransferase
VEFQAHDLERLERLRAAFLAGRGRSPWRDRRDFELYDAFFGQRIAWKWEAVLSELERRGFTPTGGVLLDWGAGTGVAARAWLARFGAAGASEVRLYDASPAALEFARERIAAEHPGTPVQLGADGAAEVSTLLVSHVIPELSASELEQLLERVRRAACVVWVEPGSRDVSRALGRLRDGLLESFDVLAPCTHRERCPVLAAGHEQDWCHFFARPPAEVFTRSDWARVGQRLSIDLRSLPYSFVALRAKGARPAPPSAQDYDRIIGRPRIEKGRAQLVGCRAEGLRSLRLLERDDRALFKELERGAGPSRDLPHRGRPGPHPACHALGLAAGLSRASCHPCPNPRRAGAAAWAGSPSRSASASRAGAACAPPPWRRRGAAGARCDPTRTSSRARPCAP